MADANPIAPPLAAGAKRLPAVDAMRGLVMVLMTVDHASHAFNAGRYVTDSMAMYQPGSVIPVAQFLVRWVTHLCAPTFVFLAGLALAFSVARKRSSGISERRIDGDLIVRGLFIMALDPLWMSLGFGGGTIFQVLYAIGGGLCCMALLRRMGTRALLAAGLALMLAGEALAGLSAGSGGGRPSGPIGALLVTGGRLGGVGYVLYPLLPWLAYMILGLGAGRLLVRRKIEKPVPCFTLAGFLLLALFVLVRGLNGYGNMLLYRDDLSLVQWLHVSKYPPSLSFALLTLGLMCLALAVFFRVYSSERISGGAPLLVFGRTPLFFYVLHVHLLGGAAVLLGLWEKGGLLEAFTAAIAVLLALYPLCRWYGRFKRSHPGSLLRFV
jgi:uncharacterized membrane protein